GCSGPATKQKTIVERNVHHHRPRKRLTRNGAKTCLRTHGGRGGCSLLPRRAPVAVECPPSSYNQHQQTRTGPLHNHSPTIHTRAMIKSTTTTDKRNNNPAP
ncbi:unnamed protein product, partial [Ectocarpus sp. 12 AP-2014]